MKSWFRKIAPKKAIGLMGKTPVFYKEVAMCIMICKSGDRSSGLPSLRRRNNQTMKQPGIGFFYKNLI